MLKNKKTKKSNYDIAGYFFIAPAYIIFTIFMLIPIFVGIYYSLTNYNFYNRLDFVGLDNYIHLFKDKIFIKSIKNTFVYAFFTIGPQIVIGLLVAVILYQGMIGKKFFRAVIYTPNVTSMIAISMIWLWILDPSTGFLNRFMKLVGLKQKMWLFEPGWAMACIVIITIISATGYNMVIYLAGLSSIPSTIYEAANIDGANGIQKFFKITVPLLKNTTFFLFITATINSFRVFEQVSILTDGGPINSTTTIVHQIYNNAFKNFRMGYASAQGTLLLFIIIIITVISYKYGSTGQDREIN